MSDKEIALLTQQLADMQRSIQLKAEAEAKL